MEKLKKYLKGISDKLKDARMYTEWAIELEGEDKETAELFYKVGKVDAEHAEKLKDAACEDIRKSSTEEKKHVWAFEKNRFTEEMLEIRRLQELYKA